MSDSKELADFVFDLGKRMNQAAALQFRPCCDECGQVIEGPSYNHKCGPCARQSVRDEFDTEPERQSEP